MTQKPTFDYDIIVIGSGAAGSPAASIIARAGKKVAIIEKATFGGESPNWGDIPTGALLHTAALYRSAKDGAKFGLRTGTVGYNYPSLLSWKTTAVKRTGAGGNRSYYEKQGISVFAGNAHFLSPNEIAVNRRHLSARKFLIATGSEWVTPDIPGLADTPHHTPQTILSLTRPPKSLCIIGGGSTAMEFAYLFSAFGTKVYIAEQRSRILPSYEPEVSDLISIDAKQQRGMTIFRGATVVAAQKDGLHKRITYRQNGRDYAIKVDEVLVATGRTPATDFGLENAGVAYSDDGIAVNDNLQTSARHIFAAGSVVDVRAQTHTALTHSRAAAHNLLHRSQIVVDDAPSVRVLFTHPQIATTGLTESECRAIGQPVKTAVAPLTLTARSNITDHRTGFVKLISNKKGVLLGGTIVAPQASDMIAQLTLAVRHGLTAEQLMTTPNCFVSWTEAVRIAAGKLL